MSNLMKGKVYGLTIPKAAQKASSSKPTLTTKKASIFNQSDSDSNDSDSEDWVKKSMKKKADANNAGLKKQSKIAMAKAMEEDPTVFQYDEVYDKLEEKKVEEEQKNKEVDRKPKYISNLLKSAEIRKKDYERMIERKVQKEREAEGDMYADKEKFVTSAYRQKMEEMAEAEAEEERKARMEEALDVTKQKDLSGFYRHIYRQTWGEEKGQKKVKEEQQEITEEPSQPEMTAEQLATKVKEEMKKIKVESDEEDDISKKESVDIKKVEPGKKRAIRQKQDEDTDSQDSNDSDSDSSGDSSDENDSKNQQAKTANSHEKADAKDKSEMTAEEKLEQKRKEMREAKEKREKRKRRIEQDEGSSESEGEGDSDGDKKKKKKKEGNTGDTGDVDGANKKNEAAAIDNKPKVDIWKKRTVGDVLEDARQRYWQRVADRGSRRD